MSSENSSRVLKRYYLRLRPSEYTDRGSEVGSIHAGSLRYSQGSPLQLSINFFSISPSIFFLSQGPLNLKSYANSISYSPSLYSCTNFNLSNITRTLSKTKLDVEFIFTSSKFTGPYLMADSECDMTSHTLQKVHISQYFILFVGQ